MKEPRTNVAQFDDQTSGAHGELERTKPDELRDLAPVLGHIFDRLKLYSGLDSRDSFEFDIAKVDCAHEVLTDRVAVAAFTLRKIQALHLLTRDGVQTTNSMVVRLAAELNVALSQLAGDALVARHKSTHDVLIDGRNQINQASSAAATLCGSEIVVLI